MASSKPSIENISSSIVREYLNRKGLVQTLQAMDEEMPRTEASFNKRAALAKEAFLDKLMKKNKDQSEPLRTMLEVLLKYHIDRMSKKDSAPLSTISTTQAPTQDASHRPRTTRQDSDEKRKVLLKSKSNDIADFDGLPQQDTGQSYRREGTLHVTMREESESRRVPTPMLQQSEIIDRERDARLSSSTESKKSHGPSSSRSRGLGGPVTSNVESKKFSKRSTRGITPPVQSSDLSTVATSGLLSPGKDTTKNRLKDFGFSFDEDMPTGTTMEVQSQTLSKEPDLLNDLRETRSKTRLVENAPTIKEVMDNHKMAEERTSSSRRSRQSASKEAETKRKTEVTRSPKKQFSDLEMDDLDDMENDLRDVQLGPSFRKSQKYVDARPLGLKKASELKSLIFGTPSGCFNEEWMKQGFPFNNHPELEFGIVQHKGGSCGVLASVQACFLRNLLFVDDRTLSTDDLRPSKRVKNLCLAKTLAEILWQAGGHKRVVVAMPSGKVQFTTGGRYKADGLTETLILYHFASLPDLEDYLSENIGVFLNSTGNGVVIFLYSLVFSKSIEEIIDDMDEPTNRLMGHHNYCTQEMVNLILTGRAVSNTFNDVMELDSGTGPKCILKGLKKRSDVGLLSLFEHYGSCKVGSYYKTPRYPVWVVCSESHFSVAFSLKRNLLSDWKAERNFDLYYYDGLANQDELIRLSVNTIAPCPPASDTDLIPPLEHCIRTKWPDALIDWNGTEPIL